MPDVDPDEDYGTLRQWWVELVHKGHQGAYGTKQLLSSRLWWPGMDKMVEAKVESCLPFQATTPSHHRDPLQPNTAPTLPKEFQSRDQ